MIIDISFSHSIKHRHYCFDMLFRIPTDNKIGILGAAVISEVLKTNHTLTSLIIWSREASEK